MGVVFFLFVVALQVVAGYSPIAAGAATVPMTVSTPLLSARAGALAQKIGPWIPMTAGLVVVTIGMVLMTWIAGWHLVPDPGAARGRGVALGLSAVVALLTATMLATADVRHAGSGQRGQQRGCPGWRRCCSSPRNRRWPRPTGDAQLHPLALYGFRIAIVASAALVACGAGAVVLHHPRRCAARDPAAQARMHDQLRGRREPPRGTGAEDARAGRPEARHARGRPTPSAGCSALAAALRPEAAVTRPPAATPRRTADIAWPFSGHRAASFAASASSRRPSSM